MSNLYGNFRTRTFSEIFEPTEEQKKEGLNSIDIFKSIFKNSGIPLNTLVSMNMWGLQPEIFDKLSDGFIKFLKENNNPLKGEYFLPFLIDSLIKHEGRKVRVLAANEKWYGVTYKEDKETVKKAFEKFTEGGLYNGI